MSWKDLIDTLFILHYRLPVLRSRIHFIIQRSANICQYYLTRRFLWRGAFFRYLRDACSSDISDKAYERLPLFRKLSVECYINFIYNLLICFSSSGDQGHCGYQGPCLPIYNKNKVTCLRAGKSLAVVYYHVLQ